MSDCLSLTNALADANIDRQKAERIATEIFDAIHDNVATKADLDRVETVLKADVNRLEARIELVEHQHHASRRLDRRGGRIALRRAAHVAAAQLTAPQTLLAGASQVVERG